MMLKNLAISGTNHKSFSFLIFNSFFLFYLLKKLNNAIADYKTTINLKFIPKTQKKKKNDNFGHKTDKAEKKR